MNLKFPSFLPFWICTNSPVFLNCTVKRAIRALESEDYKKASSKPNSRLPQITDREQALAALKLLPINRLAFQVVKLDTEDAIKANLKPKAGVPYVCRLTPTRVLRMISTTAGSRTR